MSLLRPKTVGQRSVRLVQTKVTAIEQYPAPATKKELQRFPGRVGYYRSFCKHFSTAVAPLTNFLKGEAKYIWSAACQQAFENVKSVFCSPVLAAPCMD